MMSPPPSALMQTATLTVLLGLLANLMQNQGQTSGTSASNDASGATNNSSSASGSSGSSGSSGKLDSSASAPSKNGFAEALLQKLGAPVTPENLKFLDAWQKAAAEGSWNPRIRTR